MSVKKNGNGRPSKRRSKDINTIEYATAENLKASMSVVAQPTILSYGACQLILKKNLHRQAYKLAMVS